MDFRVIFSRRALSDLGEIVRHIAKTNPSLAISEGNRLVDAAVSLARFPRRYPQDSILRGARKAPFPPYLIYYKVEEKAGVVTIRHFWHGARQPPLS